MTGTCQDITELKNDVQELEAVLGMVNRSNVRMIIADAISTLRTKVEEVNRRNTVQEQRPSAQVPRPNVYTVKIANYGWDESAKFVKVYVSLPNIDKLTQEQITCDFTNQSFRCSVNNHNSKNHVLEIPKLAGNISPATSTCRLKSSNIILSLRKEKEGATWGQLTDAMRKEKEKKDVEMESSSNNMDSTDPSAGIMKLMKKMYDDGDDEMKRTIKKTWYESQNKQKESGGMPGGMPAGMPGMPGGMPGMPGGMPGMPPMGGMGF